MADTPEKEKKEPQREKKDTPSGAKKTPSGLGVTEIQGFWEGMGQFPNELVAGRPIWHLIILWLMALITAKLAVSSVEELIERDPKLRELKAIEKEALITHMSKHGHLFLDRAKNGVLAVKKEIYDKVTTLYQYLTKKDTAGADAVQKVVTRVQTDTDGIRERRKKIGFNPRSWRH